LMEREIQIYKVVAVQAVENTLFYLTIIVMVFAGYEIESLVVAVLARSVLGLVLIYIMRPWYPKTGFSYVSAKRLLSYGLPFQGNSFLALIKDDLLIIYLGGAIGLTNLGFVTFAKKWSEFSLRIITDNMNRVAFPLFARFQTNKVLLKKSLKKVFFFSSFFIFPMIVGAIFVFDSVLRVIPGYFDKWGIALFSFYFFSLYALIVSLYTPLINLFNAIGKVKISLYFMIIFTVVQWALVLLSIPIFGFHGISIAFLAMSVLAVFVIRHAKKYLAFSLWEFVKENLYAVVVMVMYLVLVRMAFIIFVDMPRVHVALSMVGGAGIYFVMIYRLKGREFYRELFDMAKVGRKSL
ncbi:MAG: oligosaccharide flippase family protein, partial [Candidatus Paceibacterota bacterium]